MTGSLEAAPHQLRDYALLADGIRGALATRQAVVEDLCEDDDLYRYGHPAKPLGEPAKPLGEPAKPLGEVEGAFLICNFWMALVQLRAGDVVSGSKWFERARASCSSTGLFSEEYDVAQHQLRGNLPQASVHALLIECAAEVGRA